MSRQLAEIDCTSTGQQYDHDPGCRIYQEEQLDRTPSSHHQYWIVNEDENKLRNKGVEAILSGPWKNMMELDLCTLSVK